MAEKRQAPIPVNMGQRVVLDMLKERAEILLGHKVDWGDFLIIVVSLGVTLLGEGHKK